MANFEISDGMVKYLEVMEKLGASSTQIVQAAVFEGAGEAIGDIRKAVEALPESNRDWGTEKHPLEGVREYEKAAMTERLGLAPIQNDDGFVNTKVGYDGYYEHEGRKIPIPMIARAVERGTTFMTATHIHKKTTRAIKPKIIALMDNSVKNAIEKIM